MTVHIRASRKVGKMTFQSVEFEGEATLVIYVGDKEYDETDPYLLTQPQLARAPQSVLDTLSATDDRAALQFRKLCQEWANRPVGLRMGETVRYRRQTWTKCGPNNLFRSQYGYERHIPPHELLKARRCKNPPRSR